MHCNLLWTESYLSFHSLICQIETTLLLDIDHPQHHQTLTSPWWLYLQYFYCMELVSLSSYELFFLDALHLFIKSVFYSNDFKAQFRNLAIFLSLSFFSEINSAVCLQSLEKNWQLSNAFWIYQHRFRNTYFQRYSQNKCQIFIWVTLYNPKNWFRVKKSGWKNYEIYTLWYIVLKGLFRSWTLYGYVKDKMEL